MKIPVIRSLAERHELSTLEAAEAALLEERKPDIEVPGDDEGEQLTHVMAAAWIKRAMANGLSLAEAVRAYVEKVRASIS
ncbi:MAG: hypothetical protein RMM53_07255 [Bacteroidia bacterium]|nr:hypothetical protein [Bacteroidia bacterium]MDW8333996.1 hypothetical protein [Bacteroidia bacterium]